MYYVLFWDGTLIGVTDDETHKNAIRDAFREDDPSMTDQMLSIWPMDNRAISLEGPRPYLVPNTRFYPTSLSLREPKVAYLWPIGNGRPTTITLERVGSREWFVSGQVTADSRDKADRLVRRMAREMYQMCRQQKSLRAEWTGDEVVIHPPEQETYFRDGSM